MTENTPPEAVEPPVNPAPTPAPPVASDPAPVATAPAPRFRDRVLGIRGVAAVALAGLVIGGGGGFALGAVTDGGDDRMGPGRAGFGGPGQFQQFPGRPQGGQQGGPGQVFPGGQMPPGTAPQEDMQPDVRGESSGGTNS